MKPVLTDLAELYLQQLKGFLTSEKKYGKVIEKLTAAVVTDELKRALALTSADLPQQKERIKQCLALLNRKATAASGKTDLPFLEHIKLNKVTAKPSVLNDIKILHIRIIMVISCKFQPTLYILRPKTTNKKEKQRT
ncbi:MAG: DUF892 family protein [Pedobacter sp.]|uniref:DUF892 family protein n=1 Tax=Pedobacter sp. TaxID=1411316 RepID=UPI003562D2CD